MTFPRVPLRSLDTLWIQVAGTLCNLRCTHCFVSCSPTNHAHRMMSLAELRPLLAEAAALGVKEYYLTGGEPFLNPELLEITEVVLGQGPVTILTNGVLLRAATCLRLRELVDRSEYSLDLRVSLDGWDAATNDLIRGAGSWERALAGIRNLAAVGISPVLTVTEACEGAGSREGRARLLRFLGEFGVPRPRLKVLPLLRIGAEATRSAGYAPHESLADVDLGPEELDALQCSSCRMVTSQGVYVCPILIDEPRARLGARLADAVGAFPLAHAACSTCHAEGLSCRT